MRVLVVTPWPLDSAGGAQALARQLAAALAREPGLDVHAACGALPGERRLTLPAPPHPVTGLAPVARSRLSGPPFAWQVVGRSELAGLEDLAARLRPQALVFVGHHSCEARQAARAARAAGAVLCLWPLVHLDARRHTNAAAARLYRSAALVVASSEPERAWLLRAGVAPARLVRLDCGAEAAARPFPGARLPARGEPLALLSVGALAPHKRAADQIDALAALAARGIAAHLTLAGVAREPGALDALRARIRARGLEGRVAIRSGVDAPELAGLHAAAHAFLFTSASESFGLALLDALCAGCLPVVYPHPVYRGLVEESGFGRVADAERPEALARALAPLAGGGPPTAPPRPDWLSAHAWPRVAAALAEPLARVAR
jgi:glycosyltransferase involved in cell wall biosynthesis